ncbi:MAG TPA: YihY/virulence factor BrkB family protein [Bryobacteraceae bacterium]|nr:YihY/virulence factor BrkB family protein [Bryobacteraceae bacterium]
MPVPISAAPRIETTGIEKGSTARQEVRRASKLQWVQIKALLTATVTNWFDHKVPRLGASLAFYSMLSIAPLLVVVIAVAGFFFGRQAAEGQIVWQIQDLVGREGAEAIQAMLKGAHRPAAGALATFLGLMTLFFGASSVVAELRDALNTIWCVPTKRTGSSWRSIVSTLRDRTMAFGVVLGVGFLLLVSLALNAALSALGGAFGEHLPTPEWLLQAANFLFSFLVIAFLFSLMYKMLPDLLINWSDVWLGGAITSLLFTLGKLLIGIYLGRAGISSTYGAAGSLVILLVWVYYSAQIFFLGAEFTLAYAQTYGSRPCDHIGREVQVVETMPENPASCPPPEAGANPSPITLAKC